MRYIAISCLLIACSSVVWGQNAPEPRQESKRAFYAILGISAGAVALDAYETPHCSTEDGSAFLYGKHPQPLRVNLVMAGELIGAAFASHKLQQHHSRFWALPLGYLAAVHVRGGIHDVHTCR